MHLPARALPFYRCRSPGALDNTFVVLWSDHGRAFGGHYFTPEGQEEHRNPLLSLMVPKSWLQMHPDEVSACSRPVALHRHARMRKPA